MRATGHYHGAGFDGVTLETDDCHNIVFRESRRLDSGHLVSDVYVCASRWLTPEERNNAQQIARAAYGHAPLLKTPPSERGNNVYYRYK